MIKLTVQEQAPVDLSVEALRVVDAVSPTVQMVRGEDRVTITVHDLNGDHTADIYDGEIGPRGEAGLPGPKGDKGDPGEVSQAEFDELAGEVSDLNQAITQKYTKPQTGIPASDLASGVIPAVPVQDVQVNGTSILDNGMANVPFATSSTPGVVTANNWVGFDMAGSNIRIFRALQSDIKAGTHAYRPVTPSFQDQSVFYGLAKAAGADMASSSNPVGTYTDAAKIAIQKMLGIYEAPWELIREDTFTNETEADHIITVDGNGQAFELTDVRLLFELPKVDATASKGCYGQTWFYYDDTNNISAESGTFSRTTATDYARGCWYFLEYDNGMVTTSCTSGITSTNAVAEKFRYITYTVKTADAQMGMKLFSDFSIKKINIKSVTGTGHYKLYGKRKWQ